MQHFRSLDALSLQGAWLTIGSFDGVHLGHQAIIRNVVLGAQRSGAPAAVLTFHPHPGVVLGWRQTPFYLTSPQERAELLGALGVDVVITHPFDTQVAARSAAEFMHSLKKHLGLRALCVGPNFALGRGREGNTTRLAQLGIELGYELHIAEPVLQDGEVISSTRVRRCLESGDVAQANRLLGRPFSLWGAVVAGDGRGRTIGIPTANLQVWEERLVPLGGVYACRAVVAGRSRQAVVNIGVRPTFGANSQRQHVEVHILDFDANLYGSRLRLDFIARLRDEQRFPGVQALIAQIQADIQQARRLLA